MVRKDAMDVPTTKISRRMEKEKLEEKKVEGASVGEGSSGKRGKKVYNVEPRTPLKRQRIPVQRFQSPAVEEGAVLPQKPKSPHEERVLLFNRGSFLTVRNEKESFYLCKAIQNVYKTSKTFKVQWLSLEQNPNIYKLDYLDHTELECVLSNVRMDRVAKDTYRLPHSEEVRAGMILRKALNVEKGLPINEGVEEVLEEEPPMEEGEEEEEEEGDIGEASKPKKAKKESPQKVKKTPGPMKTATLKGGRRQKLKPYRAGKQKRKAECVEQKRKGPDRHLKPDPRITVLDREPFFETRDKVPFISKQVQGKLAIRAVILNDVTQLKSVRDDFDKVYTLDCPRSVANPNTALHYAIERQNKDAIQLLLQDYFGGNNERMKKTKPQSVLIDTQETGRYNYRSLGVQHIQSLTMSRGSKEGNNAFTKDLNDMRGNSGVDHLKYLDAALKQGVSIQTLHQLACADKEASREEQMSSVYGKVHLAVLHGHRKLAGKLVEEVEKFGGSGFNFLHKEVLLFEKEDLRASILPSSVKKKPIENFGMTPLHCASINPNTKYLSRLLSVEPDFNLPDKAQRRPIHYAAVCMGSAPLEFLLSRGASPHESDTQGMTPLHFACQAGRVANVEILLKRAKSSGSGESDFFVQKYGIGGINRPNRASLCPIHIAVEKGNIEVVRCLIKYKVEINKQLSAGKEKLTPLMTAACRGYLDIVRILVENGATIEQPDKMKRTALIHAVMNGNTHIASYFVRMGADPNRLDSSGNSVVHYASAYGWYFCVKLLLENAGADPNKSNDWKVTPVAIAFLKGHLGLVDYLLGRPGVDINFKDDKGMTLVSIAAASPLVSALIGQLEFLIKDKGADCSTLDINGYTPLHFLCQNNVRTTGSRWSAELSEEAMEISVRIAELLIDNGCNPSVTTGDGQTALMLAVEQANIPLVELLMARGSTVTMDKNKEGKNVLHLMSEQCMEASMAPLVKLLAEQKPKVIKIVQESPKKCPDSKTETKKENKDSTVNGKGETAMEVDDAKTANHTEKPQAEKIVSDVKETETPPKATGDHNGEEKMDVTENSVDEKGDNAKEQINNVDVKSSPKKVNSDVIPQIARFEALKDTHVVKDRKEVVVKEVVTEVEEILTKSGIQILENLSQGVDHEGFTPLLRACQKYRGFWKQSKLNNSDEKPLSVWREGRRFMQTLIDLTKADVNAIVQMKTFSGEIPSKEEQKYTPEGKSCALHLLSESQEPVPKGSSEEGLSPAVQLLLKYKPRLELLNVHGLTPLISALQANRDPAAEALLDSGANPNVLLKDKEHKDKTLTPVLMATRNCDISPGVLRKLVVSGGEVNCFTEENGFTPLHYIVQKKGIISNKLEKLCILLGKGAKINAKDREGMTALHITVQLNSGKSDASLEVEELLIEKGADLLSRDNQGRLPIHYVFMKNGSSEDNSALDPVELCSSLTSAMQGRQLDEKDKDGQTALHRAAFRGATICCMHLLERKAAINIKDNNGNTPLSLAVLNKHDSCAIMLIQKGASVKNNIVVPPSVPSDEGSSSTGPVWKWKPLREVEKEERKEYSVFQGAIAAELQGVAHMMLDVPTDTSKLDPTVALEAALCVNKFYVASRLLKRIRDHTQLHAVNAEGRTLLHILALKTNPSKDTDLQIQIAELLIKSGVSVSRADKYGCTALIYTGLQHHYKLGHYILDHCAEVKVDHCDRFGRDVMAATFWNIQDLNGGPPEVRDWTEALCRRGCKMDLLSDYPMPDPLLFGYTFLERGTDDYFVKQSDVKLSPLIIAVNNCEFDLVQFMLKHGASPAFSDNLGRTPLMHAVRMNDVLMVKLLLNNDFDPGNVIAKVEGQPKLSRKLSRQLFTITTGMPPAEQDMPELEKVEKENEDKSDNGDGDTDIVSEENSDGEKDKDDEEELDNEFEEEMSNESDEEHDQKQKHSHKLTVKQRKRLPAIIRKLAKRQRQKREFKTIEKTSGIDLASADLRGWTTIHHLVSPLEIGTYDNEEILYILAKAGSPLLKKDSAGLTPLEHALIRGAPRLTNMLQELTGVDKNKMERPIFSTREVCDGIKWDCPVPNINEDAESLLKRLESRAMDTNKSTKSVAVPDDNCNIKDTGEVLADIEQKIPYDALLSKVDVGSGSYDVFNFYKMQIVKQRGKSLYVLFTCWGRIGDQGQFQHTPFNSAEEAVKEFSKIFKSKTGNEWTNVKDFKALRKKYRLVPVEQRERGSRRHSVSIDLTSSKPSVLPTHLQNLVKLMSDSRVLERALDNSRVDTDIMPLGRIQRSALLKAREILQQIAVLIKLNEDIGHTNKEDQYQENMEKISLLSSEYYHLTPRSGYDYERLCPVTTEQDLAQEFQTLSNLIDYELASRILMAAHYRRNEMNPVDYIYRSLGCQLQQMTEGQTEMQYLLKYIYNSCPQCRVQAIYKVSRPDEERETRSLNLDNHTLLWHGTGLSNLLSILSRGLLVAPPEAPTTGQCFGKGVYLSNAFEKSRHYCDNYSGQQSKDSRVMLLCEVALGKMKETEELGECLTHTDKHDSLLAMGEKIPDDTFNVVLPYGPVVPLGPLIPRIRNMTQYFDLEFNEFVVHNPAQICLRYVLQFQS